MAPTASPADDGNNVAVAAAVVVVVAATTAAAVDVDVAAVDDNRSPTVDFIRMHSARTE